MWGGGGRAQVQTGTTAATARPTAWVAAVSGQKYQRTKCGRSSSVVRFTGRRLAELRSRLIHCPLPRPPPTPLKGADVRRTSIAQLRYCPSCTAWWCEGSHGWRAPRSHCGAATRDGERRRLETVPSPCFPFIPHPRRRAKSIAHSVPPSSSDNEKSTARTVSQPPPRPTHTPRRPRLDGTAAAPYARVVADRENDEDASERRTRQPPGGAADAGGRDRRREPLQPRLFHGRAPPQLAPESAAAASPRGRGCHRTPVSVAGAGAPLRSARRRGHRPPPPCPPFDNKSAAAAATAAAPAQLLQGAPRVRSAGPARGRRVAAVMPPVAAGRPRWKRTRNRGRKQKRREEKTHAMVSKNEGGKKHGGGQRVEAQMGGEGENTQGEHLVE